MQTSLQSIDQLSASQIDRWNRLLQTATPVKSPFLSYAFCRAVQDVRGGVFALDIHYADGSEAFLPFQHCSGRGFLGHAEKVGGAMSDMFGMVGHLKNVDANCLLRVAGLTSLRFDHAVRAMCPFSFQDAEKATGVRVHISDFAEFTNALLKTNKDFAKEVARAERRLRTDLGPIEFQWEAIDAEAALNRLVAAKREQYRRTGVPDGLAARWRRDLLARLLKLPPTLTCKPVLSTLSCNGEWIASNLGLICEETFHIWYPAYNTAYRRYSPGHLLFFKIMDHGCTNGLRDFDFGEGQSSYKAEYGGEEYELWKGAIRSDTLGGRSERAFQSIKWRISGLRATARRRP